MGNTSKWIIGCGVLLLVTAAILTGCVSDQPMPPPVALTNTPLPPPPTEAPTSTPVPVPTEAPTSTPTPVPTDTPPASPTPAPVGGIPAPSPTRTPQPTPTEVAERLTADLAGTANQIYRQKNCVACHGANYEGGLGSILVGLPTDYFQAVTRRGEPEAGMPAFDQNAINDYDLSTLAEFLSSLTLQDIDVELPPVVVGHLSQAWDALQEGDKAAVQTYLDKAQEAGADAPPGVQATLKGLAGGLDGADWMEDTEAHLEVLLGR